MFLLGSPIPNDMVLWALRLSIVKGRVREVVTRVRLWKLRGI